MTYALVAILLSTGHVYLEQSGLKLQACAGRLALLRRETDKAMAKLKPRIGEVRYLCIPERVTISGAP